MAYRDDLAALAARKAALDVELAVVTREREEAARDLDAATRRHLPLVADIRVATPCTADWAMMVGDDRARHCTHCSEDVFNFSAMTRVEVEALLYARNGELCARFYKRKDGTVLLADCDVGRKERQSKLRLASAGLLVTITAGTVAATHVRPPPASSLAVAYEEEHPDSQRTFDAWPEGAQGRISVDLSPSEEPRDACDDYINMIDLYASCAGLPPTARDSMAHEALAPQVRSVCDVSLARMAVGRMAVGSRSEAPEEPVEPAGTSESPIVVPILGPEIDDPQAYRQLVIEQARAGTILQ